MNAHWLFNKIFLGIAFIFAIMGTIDAHHHAWGYLAFDGIAILLNLWCAQDAWKRFMKDDYEEYRRHRW